MKAKKKLKLSRACCCFSHHCPARCSGSTISQDSGLSSFLRGLNRSGMVREVERKKARVRERGRWKEGERERGREGERVVTE